MKFEDLLNHYSNQPFIEIRNASLLLKEPLTKVKVQFSRFVASEKLIKLRNGIYLFNNAYRKSIVNSLALSSIILQPSYISMEKALEAHGLIPENVYAITALTTKRANKFYNVFGKYEYRHIQKRLFFGYDVVGDTFSYYMATPEKALLDYLYVNKIFLTNEVLVELRLQNLNVLDFVKLKEFASIFNKKNIYVAVERIEAFANNPSNLENIL